MLRHSLLLRCLAGASTLKEHDPILHQLIDEEHLRQRSGLELIASENFTSKAVMECLGSILTNKYAEGRPGRRYYGGTAIVDRVEEMCRQRALEAYRLDPQEWDVNVQPYSGSPANFAVLSAVLEPHDRLMGLHLYAGGHLTHGFYTARKRVSASAKFFESFPYGIGADGLVDVAEVASQAQRYLPKLLIAGASAYPRDWDYHAFRRISNDVGALLMVDMAHISGLVAAQEHHNPFEVADIVTTTTHKTMRGPRAGLIFVRRQPYNRREGAPFARKDELCDRIHDAVFPMLQGGPHMNSIAAVATQLKELQSDEWKDYARQVKANAATLAQSLMKRGEVVVSGGTDNHLVLWDLSPRGMTGSKMEKLLDMANISTNRNYLVEDHRRAGGTRMPVPHGLRLGTPALTTRGMKEADLEVVGEFLHRSLDLGLRLQREGTEAKLLSDFVARCEGSQELAQLREDVRAFALPFHLPGGGPTATQH